MKALVASILVLGLGTAHAAETGKTAKAARDEWKTVDKSMTGLLSEGYRLVSVVAPSSQLRVYFLSKGAAIVKCSEEAALRSPPPAPRPGEKGEPKFDPRFVPEMETKVECSRLVKGK